MPDDTYKIAEINKAWEERTGTTDQIISACEEQEAEGAKIVASQNDEMRFNL